MHVGGPWMASISADERHRLRHRRDPGRTRGPGRVRDRRRDGHHRAGRTRPRPRALRRSSPTSSTTTSRRSGRSAPGWPPLRTDIPADAVAENPVVAALTEIAPTSRPLLPGVVNSVDVLDAVDDLTQRALAGEDLDALLPTAQDEIQAALAVAGPADHIRSRSGRGAHSAPRPAGETCRPPARSGAYRPAPSSAAGRRSARRGATSLLALAFLAPALVILVAFVAWPMLSALRLSFTDASGFGAGGVGRARQLRPSLHRPRRAAGDGQHRATTPSCSRRPRSSRHCCSPSL